MPNKYILNYNSFLKESNNVNKQKVLREFQIFLKSYGNAKNILSFYNLQSLKNKRNALYQKNFKLFEEIKYEYNYKQLVLWIKEIDNEFDEILYLLSEFRKGLRDYKIQKDPDNDYVTFIASMCDISHQEAITVIKDGPIMSMFKIFCGSKNKNVFITNSGNKFELGSYHADGSQLIELYWNNIFEGESFVECIIGNDENWNKKLQKISPILYHEISHKYQDIIKNRAIKLIPKNEPDAEDTMDKSLKYLSLPFEIEAHALEFIKDLELNKKYTLKEILSLLKQPIIYRFRGVSSNLDSYLDLKDNNKTLKLFLKVAEDFVIKKLKDPSTFSKIVDKIKKNYYLKTNLLK